jgi:alpha-glucosidase
MTDSHAWWRGATFYQIYPRSFADSNGDGIGDLAGITARLEYVAALGVDGIWLSPFFCSPMRDFGYDVRDHCAVDPMFGNLDDFDALLARAHALGLKVLIDQVWSHTAIEHPWFEESRQSRDNAKADWYVWADAKPDGAPPNNWQSWMGGAAWTWEPRRGQYYLHNFLPQMPDLNFHCAPVQDAVLQIARFWLDRGVDGFRLDTANFYFHNRALTDNPPQPPEQRGATPVTMQVHVHNVCQPENLAFLARLRQLLDQYENRMTVAEIGSADNLARMVEYTAGHQRLHTAYSFLLLGERHDPGYVAELMAPWQLGAGASAWASWAFSNHDVPRVATRWAGVDGDDSAARCQQWLALLVSLRGTVFLYQGEELGLPQAQIAFADLQDPFGKAQWPQNPGRDGCRTPMPWIADVPHAGFSSGRPWLPLDPRHSALAVDRQLAEPHSTLQVCKRLLALRRAHPALRCGSFEVLVADTEVLLVLRQDGDDRVLVALNLGVTPRTLALPFRITPAGPAFTLGQVGIDSTQLQLNGRSSLIQPIDTPTPIDLPLP